MEWSVRTNEHKVSSDLHIFTAGCVHDHAHTCSCTRMHTHIQKRKNIWKEKLRRDDISEVSRWTDNRCEK